MEREEEDSKGYPVRKIFINPSELKNASLYWYIIVTAKEKESSPFFKAMFKEMLLDIQSMMNFGSIPNKEGLEEEFARVWGKSRNKLFANTNMSQDMAGVSGVGGQSKGRANVGGMPSMMGPGALAGGGLPGGEM